MDTVSRVVLFRRCFTRVLLVVAVWSWIVCDGWQTVRNAMTPMSTAVLLEPVFWNRLGVLLVAISFGLALLRIRNWTLGGIGDLCPSFASQLIILAALLALVISWGMHEAPRGEITTLMLYACPLLFIVGVVLPSALRWAPMRQTRSETPPAVE